MRTIEKIITKVDGSRGAPMGRANVHGKSTGKRIYDCLVPMYGAYDKGGAYWGVSTPDAGRVRVAYTKDLTFIKFYRENSETRQHKFDWLIGREIKHHFKVPKNSGNYSGKIINILQGWSNDKPTYTVIVKFRDFSQNYGVGYALNNFTDFKQPQK